MNSKKLKCALHSLTASLIIISSSMLFAKDTPEEVPVYFCASDVTVNDFRTKSAGVDINGNLYIVNGDNIRLSYDNKDFTNKVFDPNAGLEENCTNLGNIKSDGSSRFIIQFYFDNTPTTLAEGHVSNQITPFQKSKPTVIQYEKQYNFKVSVTWGVDVSDNDRLIIIKQLDITDNK